MRIDATTPIVWRLSLASSPAHVFELLDTDAGRERFWAERSRATDDSFELQFASDVTASVTVLDREPAARFLRRNAVALCG